MLELGEHFAMSSTHSFRYFSIYRHMTTDGLVWGHHVLWLFNVESRKA